MYNSPIVYGEYDDINVSSGAIFSKNSLKIINTTFTDNYATFVKCYEEYGFYTIKLGGAIYSLGNIEINKSKFRDKIPYNIYSVDTDLYIWNLIKESYIVYIKSGNATILNTDFSDSCYSIYSSANTIITNCNFTNNHENLIKGEKITIKNCNFINNSYDNSEDMFFPPEIIICNELEIYNSNFVNNCGIKAINLIIKNNTFTKYSMTIMDTIAGKIMNSSFANNNGHIIESRNIEFINSEIINNTITNSNIKTQGGYYGAIYACEGTIVNSTFINNTSPQAGAIHHDMTPGGSEWTDDGYETFKDDEAKELKIINSTFIGNQEAAVVTVNCTVDGKYVGSNIALDNSLNPFKLFTITLKKFNGVYASGKTMPIKTTYTKTGKPIPFLICIEIKKGKKYYLDEEYYETNSKGILNFKASTLPVGTYTMTIYGKMIKVTTTIKITKAKTTIKAPKFTAKYKKTKYFKVTVKHKTTKKAVKNIYVKIKIDKKTYKVKTNSKGVAKFNTKKLKIGKHKVVISSGNSNYQMSAKSLITIKR